MRAVLVSLCLVAAPVPRHLFPLPPPDPVQPGFRWYYGQCELQVTHRDGPRVRFRCLNRPDQTWGGIDGYPGPNEQSRDRVWAEALQYGTPLYFPPER